MFFLSYLPIQPLPLPSSLLPLYLPQINGMSSFLEFFKAPVRIMKDVIRILSLDLNSSLPSGSPPLKWTLNVCLTLPPQAPQIFPPGFCSVYIKPAMDKILLMLQLNRLPPAPAPGKFKRPSGRLPFQMKLSQILVRPTVVLRPLTSSTFVDR